MPASPEAPAFWPVFCRNMLSTKIVFLLFVNHLANKQVCSEVSKSNIISSGDLKNVGDKDIIPQIVMEMNELKITTFQETSLKNDTFFKQLKVV